MAMIRVRTARIEEVILMQSMFAAKNLRGQRDRLLEFKILLQRTAGDPIEEVVSGFDKVCLTPPRHDPIEDEVDEAFMRGVLQFQLLLQQPPEDPVEEVVSGLTEVCFHGLQAAGGYFNLCLRRVAETGVQLAPNPSFSDEQKLFDALEAAKRLPARPSTQAEALSRVQAALYAVKLTQEHLLPRCIGHLSPTPTDPAAAASATQQAAGSNMDDARATLDDAYILLNVAIKHIDLAIAAVSPFVHPKEVATSSRFADTYTSFGWDEQRVRMKRLNKW